VGDELLIPGDIVSDRLLIREITFAEMCGRYDDAELIYDPDDMAKAYEERGTPWEVLEDGQVKVWWSDEAR
jgi:hypothetical protein